MKVLTSKIVNGKKMFLIEDNNPQGKVFAQDGKPIKKENISNYNPYYVDVKGLNASESTKTNLTPATKITPQEIKKIKESPTNVGNIKIKEAQEKAQRLKEAEEAYKKRKAGAPITPELLAQETQAIGDKISLQNIPGVGQYIPDMLDVTGGIGSMASNLGALPLNLNRGNYGQALLSVAAPLATGALAGIGTENTGQFVNNLVNPLAGIKLKADLPEKTVINGFNIDAIKSLFRSSPKISEETLKAYNLAKDFKNQGLIKQLPDNPHGFEDWLKTQYNQRPLYRVVDVNPEVTNDPLFRKRMINLGKNPDDPYQVAEVMGTTLAPENVINRGRRSVGHDKLIEGTNKDIMYFAEDPSWIGERYGGNNPYYVKTYADPIPEGINNQVLQLRSNSALRKNYYRDYPNFDINKIPDGALFEDRYLRVGHNLVTPIIGTKGQKIREAEKVLSGEEFNNLSNKFFEKGGKVKVLD